MELTQENLHAMIYYDYRSGLSQKQCVDRMTAAFGDKAPSKASITYWFSEFKHGRCNLTSGRRKVLPTKARKKNQPVVIKNFSYATYKRIQRMSNISSVVHIARDPPAANNV